MRTNDSESRKVLQSINSLRNEIMQTRQQYKNLVNSFYSQNPPFGKARERGKENFAQELEIFVEIIAHCLVIGDSDILYLYVVNPLRKTPGILSRHDKIDMYMKAIRKKFNSTKSESERFYLAKLAKELNIIYCKSLAKKTSR
ncbi:hypothetical protein VB780_00350 [Leptolyngbya sp. CCNP1308]|uniref:hypothetical protein n=1 Tax=Leptolyngbya sp. CCNP1308 TaxID=3110255 RepID=UPI002B21F5CB|nr:hypothetical protein [Leptolyngbya sp. CCNP1308]MEA5446999.1 hypothetical protein [Leptolyngbya sp. CCNP1308]